MKKILFKSIENANENWNCMCSHPMQTIEWAKVRSAHGIDTVLIEVYEEDKLQNVFLMTMHKIPYSKFKIAYIPKSNIPCIETIQAVSRFALKHNLVFVKFEPNALIEEHTKCPDNLVQSAHPIFTKYNQLLALNKSEQELMNSFHSKTRYNIRLAQKKGVEVIEMNNQEGYKIFEKLYFETCARQGYRGHTPKYHKIIWDLIGNNNEETTGLKLTSKILIAFYNKAPLAAYQLWSFGKTMYYVYGGSDTINKEVMAANLLMWESIQYAKKTGCTVFDMWGSLSKDYDKQDPWAGFTRFKEGYGTKFIEYIGSYDLVLNKPLYHLYNFAHFIRQKLI